MELPSGYASTHGGEQAWSPPRMIGILCAA